VAHFDGDNGGATHRGVTGDEVRILVYFNGCCGQVTSRGMEDVPFDEIHDLGIPSDDPDEFVYDRMLRAYQRWFNARFQTYGRFVHYWVHYSAFEPTNTSAAYSPELRRADAARGIDEVDPYAVVTFAGENNDAYIEAVASQGVVVLHGLLSGISSTGFPAAFLATHPGRIWSYIPSIEQRARLVTSYVCQKVVPHPVSFSGNGDIGAPRQLGIIRSVDPRFADRVLYGELLKAGVEECGGVFVDEVGYNGNVGTNVTNNSDVAAGMASFQQRGVTTVLIAVTSAANDPPPSKSAAQIGYVPEWIVAGDYVAERPLQSRLQDQDEWEHARAVTNYPVVLDVERQQCVDAYREVDADEPTFQVKNYACEFYPSLQQLFTGIQVAGPNLSPDTMDQGFHAIPSIRSDDPRMPACFYDPGDYTCVKDAVAEWWDPAGVTPGSSQPGCMRVMEGGRRYLAGSWPDGDVEAQRGTAATDPCTAQGPDAA